MDRDELELTAALSQVNDAIRGYIMRVLDEATGHSTTEYTLPLGEVEHAVGTQMVVLGHRMQARAEEHGFIIVNLMEGEPPEVQQASGDQSRRKPDIPEF